MSDIMKPFYNACNPLKPADKHQYVDADDVRGSADLSRQFLRDLHNVEGDFLTFLFTGHLGCGKSSELYHLAERLRNPGSDSPGDRYFPIILDAEEFVDSYDVTPTDVLLSILARAAQEMKTIGIRLEDAFLWRRLVKAQEFAKDFFLSEIEVPADLEAKVSLPYAEVTGKLHLLKSDPANRRIVREALGRDISSLKQEIRLQFEKARGQLSKARGASGEIYSDFVLILDNLEKINRVQGQADGYASHRQFFIDGASQLTSLGVHVVYTVPLPVVIRDGQELATVYGNRPIVLPMIKVEERPPQHKPYPDGIERLRTLLQKRAGTTPLDALIEPKAVDFLIGNSGGHARQLLTFIRSAISLTDNPPIGLRAAYQAVAPTVDLYSRMREGYWETLAKLELSPDQQIDSGNDHVKAMLQQLIILEYRNGGKPDDPFQAAMPWYAVHPIVRQLPGFQRAVKTAQPKRAGTVGSRFRATGSAQEKGHAKPRSPKSRRNA